MNLTSDFLFIIVTSRRCTCLYFYFDKIKLNSFIN